MNPLTQKKWQRFEKLSRGYWSAVLLSILLLLSLVAELWINNKALIVHYEGEYYFPVVSRIYSNDTFGLDGQQAVNYRELTHHFIENPNGNFTVMPLIPWDPYEQDFQHGSPPTAPHWETKHFLGTDIIGRDILARLVYGFRIAMAFSLITLVASYAIGIVVGILMGYWGGKFDLVAQRVIEVWSMVPFLYVIMILVSITQPTFGFFVAINVLFGWVGMTWYMRTMTYKEVSRDYILAARAMGASTWRILSRHIFPNTMVMVMTLAPFTIAGNITALTALDYLGLGLMPPTPSWGDLLQQGKSNLGSPWIATSVVTAMVLVLIMVTFIGEALREAFDPKPYTRYRS